MGINRLLESSGPSITTQKWVLTTLIAREPTVAFLLVFYGIVLVLSFSLSRVIIIIKLSFILSSVICIICFKIEYDRWQGMEHADFLKISGKPKQEFSTTNEYIIML